MATVLINTIEGEEKQIRINEMKVKQTRKALKKVKKIIHLVKEDPEASELINYFMDLKNEQDEAEEDLTPEQLAEKEVENKIFMDRLMGIIGLLADQFPDEFVELVSITSGVDEETLDEQTNGTLFELVDAVVKENDFKELMNKGKNSFLQMAQKWRGQ